MSFLDWLKSLVWPPPPIQPPPGPVTGYVELARQRLLVLTNQYRQGRGRPPLRLHAALNLSAQRECQLCAAEHRLDHFAGGTNPWERINLAGYRLTDATENIAFGQQSADEVFGDWCTDPPHQASIVGAWEDVGFGMLNGFWCADFGTQRRGAPLPNPKALPGGLVKQGTAHRLAREEA